MNQCCSPWAARGECYNNPAVMRIVCPASCGWCTPRYNLGDNCVNRASTCKQFVLAGQCTLNYQWMTENCRKECKFCAITREQACAALGPGMAFDAPRTGSNSRCTDNSKSCCIEKLQKTCSSLPSLIRVCKDSHYSSPSSSAPAQPIMQDSSSYYAA
ncbi:shTK domain protein [Ancylostoma duodenale]|uniref:ShTK domain protein n=1 Tax=Ancylostoma duodenale TaxID=51022 RepID=A0A0C2CQR6_9BILA|nr:shTK domain protein [Ancylostoma duodenale]